MTVRCCNSRNCKGTVPGEITQDNKETYPTLIYQNFNKYKNGDLRETGKSVAPSGRRDLHKCQLHDNSVRRR